MDTTPRFLIPAGSPVLIKRLLDAKWQQHVTRRDLSFERFEHGRWPYYVFREDGYLVRVRRSDVRHRETTKL
jgi:hypothetical protein